MKIAILGTGVLATVYGAMLARAGHEVVLLGRPAAVRRVAASPARLTGALDVTQQLQAETVPHWVRRNGSADLLLVCTKAITTEEQLAPLRGARLGGAASFQNGVLKDGYLAQVVGVDRVITAETMLSAALTGEGVVVVTKGAALLSGPADPVPFARALQSAGLPVDISDDPASLVWSKASIVAAGFGVSCLSRQPAQGIFPSPLLAGLFLDLVEEVGGVAAALGVQLRDYPALPAGTFMAQSREDNLSLLRDLGRQLQSAPAPQRVSMLQDLEAGRPLEVEEVLGGMTAQAERAGVSTPTLHFCYRLLSGLEELRSK
ncbi:MAG: hypothetical protein GXX83_08675 [Gaiellales bacterium]|nr:hypothetical protein [Gaiellales bacterium]